jgi:hypothetical protein
MAPVMFDVPDPGTDGRCGHRWVDFMEQVFQPGHLAAVTEPAEGPAHEGRMSKEIAEFIEELGTWIPPDGDMVYIRQANAGLAQAEADRLRRETRPVLHPGEPLLLRGGDHDPITEDGSGGVGMESVQT